MGLKTTDGDVSGGGRVLQRCTTQFSDVQLVGSDVSILVLRKRRFPSEDDCGGREGVSIEVPRRTGGSCKGNASNEVMVKKWLEWKHTFFFRHDSECW